MKKYNTTIILFLLSNLVFGQNTLVKLWDKQFGGTDMDVVTSLQQTSDKGIIFGGHSASGHNGDKSQPSWGDLDFWVVKVDSLGNKQWDKRFGADEREVFTSLQQTYDGGYILGGSSISSNNGDKSQPNWDPTLNSFDYWIIKINPQGIKQWDKRFGGNYSDWLQSVKQTADGGYILGGWSESSISGDKTESNRGDGDFWVVKIDAYGHKQWDKRFGGIRDDRLNSLQQTNDLGYILGGYSKSTPGGDKTEPLWGLTNYWIVKIDSLGNKQWDRDYGSTIQDVLYSIQQTFDGGYILGGSSSSDSSGNKTKNCWHDAANNVTYDYWIIKTDSYGNKQWEKVLGGTHTEYLNSLQQTPDGGYLISGSSYSNLSGDKTENNLGMAQNWMVKIDSQGHKLWDKTIPTNGDNDNGSSILLKDGCYLSAISTVSGIGGYKTQSNWDTTNATHDYWIIKLCDSTFSTSFQEITNTTKVEVYPNPFTNEILINVQRINLSQASFRISNLLGQPVFYSIENNFRASSTKTIDLSFLSKGIYLLEIIVDGERTIDKILKN